uniref:Myosin-VIIa-like n=1 Tax=Phallusia mammillata TaxID=59560 RepID=A0A6F9DLU4_9ASCI|nr:myosin-VIIa-like [Phallusia mammillata]
MKHLQAVSNGVNGKATDDVTQNGRDVTQNGHVATKNVHDAIKNGHDVTQNGHMKAGSSNSDLPAGVSEMVDECFAPGVKGYFQRTTHLPVLQNTRMTSHKHNNGHHGNGTRAGNGRRKSLDSSAMDEQILRLVQTSWEIVLSFMGNESESLDKGQSTHLFETTIKERRQNFTAKNRSWHKPAHALIQRKSRTNDKRAASMYVTSQPNDDDTLMTLTRNTIANMTVLGKVRFLVMIGLENQNLRDEIYCQIIKQLVCNPTTRSISLGWILLSLVAGCFAPSKQISRFVETFLLEESNPWAEFCREKLRGVSVNGTRQTPPCSLELQAAKSRHRIRLPVICMDQSVRTIWSDSSTTAREMCQAMAAKNRLGDSFGFSLFLALDKKLVTLGNGGFYVMDAISQAEEFSRQNQVDEIWRIYFRREFFSPLDAFGIQDNQMKAWLTYSQICGGVQSEEHTCNTAQDLALLMSHQYCVRHGLLNIDSKRIFAVCQQNLPTSVFKEDRKKWCGMVEATLRALNKTTTGKTNKMGILQQVIKFAAKSFVRNFTKEFILTSFQPLDDDENQPGATNLKLKINHQLLSVMRDEYVINREKVTSHCEQRQIRGIPVANIETVQLIGKNPADHKLKLVMRDGSVYYVTSGQIAEIYEIVERFVDEWKSQTTNESQA